MARYTGRKRHIDNPISAVIVSKGVFVSKIICFFPKKFLSEVVNSMSKGQKLGADDWEAYVKEYVNIFIGRTISKINNELGVASRFIIPVIMHGEYHESGYKVYDLSLDIPITTKYGILRIHAGYDEPSRALAATAAGQV